MKQTQELNTIYKVTGFELAIHALIWAIPVLLMLAGISEGQVKIVMAIIAVFSIIRMFIQPVTVLISLPFFALLAPAGGFWSIPGGEFLVSDFLFIFLLIQMILISSMNRIKLTLSQLGRTYLFLVFMLIFSIITGLIFYSLVTFRPFMLLAQLSVLYFYTVKYAKPDQNKRMVLFSWLSSVFLGAFILIQAYFSGKNLLEFKNVDAEIHDTEKIHYLFRANYYYAGYHILTGISTVILLIKLFFDKSNILQKISYIIVIAFFLIVLLMMLNKTVILAILICSLIVVAQMSINKVRNSKKVMLGILLFVVFGFLVVLPLYLSTLEGIQSDVFLESTSGASSFYARLEVFENAFKKWLDYPVQIILGMGPDFLDGSGEAVKAISFKVSNVTGVVEGTIDSGWICYLIEMGILAFVIFATIYFKSMVSSFKYFILNQFETDSETALYIYAGLLFLSISLITQMLGYTKTAWFPFQLMLMGGMFLNKLNHQKTNKQTNK